MTVDPVGRSWGQRLFGSGSLSCLAKAHGSIAGADALFAVSLAGSLFFSVSIDAARPRVLLYLALTMAPFAVVTPLIGPVIDRVRGGQRVVIVLTCVGRGAVCLVMADELRTLLFFPMAFSVLVLGKTYSVAKSALVPRVVEDAEALVWANSRLSRTATIAGALGSGVAGAVLVLTSAPWVLRVGGGLYLTAGALALRLPRPTRTASGPGAAVRAGLRAVGLRGAVSAMGLLRGGEGFVLFLFAFALKQAGAPAWLFGAMIGAAGLGGFAGTFLAPRLRRVVGEEMLLAGGVTSLAVAAVLASLSPGRLAMLVTAVTVGTASSVGRRAFDSLVQREAPDVERGRLFARFESRFQLSWVVGALMAVGLRPPLWAGFLVLGAAAGFGAIAYALTLRDLRTAPAGQRVDSLATELFAKATNLRADGALEHAVILAAAALDVAVAGTAAAGQDHRTRAARAELQRLRRAAADGLVLSPHDVDSALDHASEVVLGAVRRRDGGSNQ